MLSPELQAGDNLAERNKESAGMRDHSFAGAWRLALIGALAGVVLLAMAGGSIVQA